MWKLVEYSICGGVPDIVAALMRKGLWGYAGWMWSGEPQLLTGVHMNGSESLVNVINRKSESMHLPGELRGKITGLPRIIV